MITKEEIERSIHGKKAQEIFNSGYNCAQSVLLAYEDYIKGKGLDPKTVVRMASPLGGGVSRLREVCGAVSALCLLIGLTDGYDSPNDEKKKFTPLHKLIMSFCYILAHLSLTSLKTRVTPAT